MPKHLLLVFSSVEPEAEEAYHEWYETHLREVAGTPGVKSGQRFKVEPVSDLSRGEIAQYLALYEIDGDLDEVLESMAERRSTYVAQPEEMGGRSEFPAVQFYTATTDPLAIDDDQGSE